MMQYNLSTNVENVDLSDIGIEKFSNEEKQEIVKLKEGITFDFESISRYGKDATKKLTEFSSKILESVRVKDAPEIEGMLLSLVSDLNRFNTKELTKRKTGLFSRFVKENTANFTTRYNTIAGVIADTKVKLQQAQHQLLKDVTTSERYLDMNRGYIKDLEKYIIASDMRIQEERKWLDEEKAKINPEDTLAIQEIAAKESDLKELEKRTFNLRLQRTIAIQNIPQLMLIKEGDTTLVAKIDDAIEQVIPLWESQMVIGLQVKRTQAGAEISKSVSNTTNALLVENASAIKSGMIGVAEENERAIVDIETLKKTNNALIETIMSIREIQRAGEEKRNEGIRELAQIQSQLNQVLIEDKNGRI